MTVQPELDLAELVSVEAAGPDHFRKVFRSSAERAFGGDLLGCAATAAMRTCEGKRLHSLHARFLRPVPVDVAIDLVVTRLSDGRRLAGRRVELRLDDKPLVEVSTSLTAAQDGAAYQEAPFPSDVPAPEDLPSEAEIARAARWEDWEPWFFEWRWHGIPDEASDDSRWCAWIRLAEPAASSAAVKVAGLAVIGDVHSDWAASRRLGGQYPRDRYISLDHVMWIHRPFDWQDWMLMQSKSDVAHGSRAHTKRQIFTRSGELVATIGQEALLV